MGPTLESHAAEGTANYEDPGGKRGARLPAVEAPVGLCQTGERHYGGWARGPGQTSKNLRETYHRAITLTDRHPFLISMQKKISGSLRGGKGSHLSFALDAPGQEISPAFEGRER